MNQERLETVFKIKERILSGVENLDSMRFIVGKFTSLSPEIENKEELLKVFAQSKSSEAVTQWFSSSELSMTDKDGIVTRVRAGN